MKRGLLRHALGLCLIWHCALQAAPQVNWGEMLAQAQTEAKRESIEIDLRQRWESTLVSGIEQSNELPLDPNQIWQWPAERFTSAPNLKSHALRQGERMVTRLTVFSERLATDFNLTVMMPRLDAVHLSYRHDGGAWKTLSAGDRVAMDRWPLADRQPSFNLPLPPGQVDLVMQFAHRGILEAPVLLQNNRAFFESRTTSIWVTGLFMGVTLVMALMGVLMALNFQKIGFLSVSVMSTMMSLVLLFGSGLGGVVLGTSDEHFNDQVKFINNTAWGMMLPWVAAVALGIQVHSRRWWWASLLLAISGLVLAMIWVDYRLRDSSPIWIAAMLMFVLMYVVIMLAWAWYKNYSRNLGITFGLLLYVNALFVLFTAYIGLLSTDASGVLAAVVSLLASICLMRGLFMQHRMGRQVLARAKISPHRDVLTGLLNREGMQAHIYKARDRMQQEQTCAVFIYILVQDAESAMNELGEQGFEMGMVQIAASLSTSVAGVDGVGRISGHAFSISVMMPPNPALATRLAQKILSRLMALASHGAPLAGTARMALAWMPLNGFRIDGIERRCLRTLESLEAVKRIGWVGGPQSHQEAAQMLRDAKADYSDPSDMPAADGISPHATQNHKGNAVSGNLYERIHRIEREMLHGVDTRFLVEDADRRDRARHGAPSSQGSTQALSTSGNEQPEDYAATELQPRLQKP